MSNLQISLIYSFEVFEQRHISCDLLLLSELEELIELTYRNNLDLRFYSQRLNISERRLNRFTAKTFGKTVYELIQDRVHEDAIRLLEYTSIPVKLIALDLGVCDAAYFSRCFKKKTGLSPREYRKTIRINRI